jgi:hypothetical protein
VGIAHPKSSKNWQEFPNLTVANFDYYFQGNS